MSLEVKFNQANHYKEMADDTRKEIFPLDKQFARSEIQPIIVRPSAGKISHKEDEAGKEPKCISRSWSNVSNSTPDGVTECKPSSVYFDLIDTGEIREQIATTSGTVTNSYGNACKAAIPIDCEKKDVGNSPVTNDNLSIPTPMKEKEVNLGHTNGMKPLGNLPIYLDLINGEDS